MTGTVDENDDIALVGEYALHLMDAQERRVFDKRLADEPPLRQLLRDWDEGLISLAADIAPVAPPRALKARIDAALFGAEAVPSGARRLWLRLGGGAVDGRGGGLDHRPGGCGRPVRAARW